MGVAERREREKEALRTLIVEAARDLLSERGLDGLSMRTIAERIEYSPATIYLYFRDKDELIRDVVTQGFHQLSHYMRDALATLGRDANPASQHRALGIAYVRFALDNTAYFRVMFELPTAAQIDCPVLHKDDVAMTGERSFDFVVAAVQRAINEGLFVMEDAYRGAIVAWGLVHGLASLYLSGHLAEAIKSREEFEALIESAADALYTGWYPRTQALKLA
jgi:AcrR family transcriptional regulator